MVRDPETWPLVRQAYCLRPKGKSSREICRMMSEGGLRSQHSKVIGSSGTGLILNRGQPA